MYPRIRDLREDHDLNQTQVAKMLGMSQTGYSKYETGKNDIPTAVLIKLARYYGTSIDYLLCETDDPQPNRFFSRRNDRPAAAGCFLLSCPFQFFLKGEGKTTAFLESRLINAVWTIGPRGKVRVALTSFP